MGDIRWVLFFDTSCLSDEPINGLFNVAFGSVEPGGGVEPYRDDWHHFFSSEHGNQREYHPVGL
jgi:hypothetical protein